MAKLNGQILLIFEWAEKQEFTTLGCLFILDVFGLSGLEFCPTNAVYLHENLVISITRLTRNLKVASKAVCVLNVWPLRSKSCIPYPKPANCVRLIVTCPTRSQIRTLLKVKNAQ